MQLTNLPRVPIHCLNLLKLWNLSVAEIQPPAPRKAFLFGDIASFPKLITLAVLLVSLLTGCKVELYSKLGEQEGNEMLALLLDHGVKSTKQSEKDNMVSLYVEKNQISKAVEVLRKNGYPKNKFSSIGDVFNKDKLISTPFEDRTRYIYGLSQEIAETLSQVDGVMVARVHVVMSENNRSKDASPASAAVFIKHNPNYDFDAYVPQIKSIVSSGIAKLSYDAVNVALFPAQQEDDVLLDRGHDEKPFSFMNMEFLSLPNSGLLLAISALLVILLLVTNVYFLARRRR